jgi:hypothetical protein
MSAMHRLKVFAITVLLSLSALWSISTGLPGVTEKRMYLSKLDLMKRIDRLHMAYPYMGSRSIQDQLNRQGIAISRARVRTLMRIMGITAVYQKPRTTIPNRAH